MLTTRQQEIVDQAMAIVVEQGTHKLTIRNVAQAIGVSEPAVYRHFASKHDLLVALLESLQRSILPIFAPFHTTSLDLQTFTDSLLTGLFGHIESNPAFALFVFTEEAFHADAQLRPLLSDMLGEMVEKLTRIIMQLQTSGNCRIDTEANHIALIILGAIRLQVTRWHLGSSEPLSDQAPSLSRTLVTLLSP